jgi:hypothetical protein
MAVMEKIEIARHHDKIVEDVEHLVGKYLRIMEWDVPEADEDRARSLIFDALKAALAEAEAQA